MKQVIRLLLATLVFLPASFGCKKMPEGILPINKMKVVFLHHIMAEEMLNNFIARNEALNFDSARTVLFSGVMKLNKTDSATFTRSINYYKADVGRFKELLDSVNALAAREKENRAKFEAARARKKEVADSLAMADSLAKLKKTEPGAKDSLNDSPGIARDSLKTKKAAVISKKDSVIVAPQ